MNSTSHPSLRAIAEQLYGAADGGTAIQLRGGRVHGDARVHGVDRSSVAAICSATSTGSAAATANFVKSLSSASNTTTASVQGSTGQPQNSSPTVTMFGDTYVGWEIGGNAATVNGAFQDVANTTPSGA